mmetsp:Transcript_43422/g.138183  ORF Transcript_43422/g.138183 Transcript_43422/m.138183 type:complete len:80 (+) Transcript_43422:61-300(+)
MSAAMTHQCMGGRYPAASQLPGIVIRLADEDLYVGELLAEGVLPPPALVPSQPLHWMPNEAAGFLHRSSEVEELLGKRW